MNKDLEMERALTTSNFMLTAIVTKTKKQINILPMTMILWKSSLVYIFYQFLEENMLVFNLLEQFEIKINKHFNLVGRVSIKQNVGQWLIIIHICQGNFFYQIQDD